MAHRSLLIAPLVAAVFIAAIGVGTHRAVRRTLADSVASELETVLRANVTALEIWIQTQERTAAVLANDPEIHPLAVGLLMSATNAEAAAEAGPGLRWTPTPAQQRFQEALGRRLPLAGYGGAHLVNTGLQVVAALPRGRPRPGAAVPEDHVARFQELFATGKPVLVTPFKVGPPPGGPSRRGFSREPRRPEFAETAGGTPRPSAVGNSNAPPPRFPPPRERRANRPELKLMQVLAPVRDSAGSVIGALAFILQPEDEFTRVLSAARPGQSGETFAFDPEGLLISQSRFDDTLQRAGLLTNAPGVSSALTLELRDPGRDLTRGEQVEGTLEDRPLMPLVAAAVSGSAGVTVEPSRDYRGVSVVGAWQWVTHRNFGVVTKVDAAEAFQPLRVIEGIFLGLVVLLALAAAGIVIVTHLIARWRRRFREVQLKARRLGQYTLEEKIGEGSMGVVYRARHALLRRDTAVKLLLPGRADEELVRQFEHEVRLTCQLSHPNTIQVYDYGHTPDGIFYYAMELLRGLTLQELVDRFGPQPEARVVHLLEQVCGSLHEAHSAGLIHRDIKPGNIILCERGGVPDTVKVLDFGLVQRLPGHATEGGIREGAAGSTRFLGTPLYMAPECIRTPGYGDPGTDLYALGAVGYFLLSGRPVFHCPSLEDLLHHHLSVEPIPLRARSPLPVSPEMDAAILACLEKDPARRPASVAELLDRIRRSPEVGVWTLERRRQWWEGPGRATAAEGMAHPPQPVPPEAATLKIDLEERSA